MADSVLLRDSAPTIYHGMQAMQPKPTPLFGDFFHRQSRQASLADLPLEVCVCVCVCVCVRLGVTRILVCRPFFLGLRPPTRTQFARALSRVLALRAPILRVLSSRVHCFWVFSLSGGVACRRADRKSPPRFMQTYNHSRNKPTCTHAHLSLSPPDCSCKRWWKSKSSTTGKYVIWMPPYSTLPSVKPVCAMITRPRDVHEHMWGVRILLYELAAPSA